ncbi:MULTISPECIES: trypco2 family protein [unclassified Streptomyces]|uniref:trypco2 family protein n=1 Tax=unclassified Streptomyces TaxID=2593676 RepID=UPI002E145EC5|nr:ATG16 family protein [Streptomyces sp. NBC_01197]WSS51553.1 ATG16 family protein [Streptomyces sp. NBC_01180]
MNDGTGAAPVAGLADLISQVRSELAEAQRRIGDSTLRLSVERVTLEIAVQVSREAGGEGKLRIGVVTVGGSGSVTRDNTHHIKVELQPRNEDDTPGWIPVGRQGHQGH